MRFRASVLIPAFLVLVVGAGCDWPMYMYGPGRTGASPDTSINQAALQGSMTLRWQSVDDQQTMASPAVANGVVFVGSAADGLEAYAPSGGSGCSGVPRACTPMWTGTTQEINGSSPAVANGVVYIGDLFGKFFAFDASGQTGCTGTPKVCAPLWTAQTGFSIHSSPVVANGIVYVGSDDDKLYAFDANGITGCSGTPKTCAPLWTATLAGPVDSSPAVSDGVVYVGDGLGTLYAFDANGATNCSGTPKTCAPLWSADPLSSFSGIGGSPAVANGVVYVGAFAGGLYAFDAAGQTGCSGTPKKCVPLWHGPTVSAVNGSPAVANGLVYVADEVGNLDAFDANGATGCSGSPVTCSPVWTASVPGAGYFGSPSLANGVVYIGSQDGNLYAFDAAGQTGCSGTPTTCSPLWTGTTDGEIDSTPAVSNGSIYTADYKGYLYAFGLEQVPPTTAIVAPASASVLGGSSLLDATASDNVSVARVEFHLTGGGLNDALIGTATPTGFGWLANWDTTSIANGDYTLNSVAFDAAGNTGRSTDVLVTIHN